MDGNDCSVFESSHRDKPLGSGDARGIQALPIQELASQDFYMPCRHLRARVFQNEASAQILFEHLMQRSADTYFLPADSCWLVLIQARSTFGAVMELSITSWNHDSF